MDVTQSDIDKIYPYLTPEEREELDRLLCDDPTLWRPLDGPQSMAYYSEADITGYGGAAGGGKTDLITGLALTAHQRSLFIRREKAQTEGIIQRLEEILGDRSGLNSQKGIWRLGGQIIEFGGCDNMGDERRWQGRAHDLKAFDEVTEQREAQVRFIMGWNRTSDDSIRPRTLMTFNPPTTTEGRWVVKFFGPWLDKKHINPAKPGELRYFTTIGDEHDYEVPDDRPFIYHKGEFIYDYDPDDFKPEEVKRPKSRTFIPSRVTDNPYYMATGYIDTLNSMPEPLRSQMLNGDFMAGVEDDEWQIIPTAWAEAAMDRWAPRSDKGDMDSLGVDPARGGRDNFCMAPRYGNWFDDIITEPGTATPDGQTGASLVVKHRRDRAVVHIDLIGWGASVYDVLNENEVQIVGINGAAGSNERAVENNLPFVNLRAQLLWRLREALDPRNKTPICLPDDVELLADLTAPKWTLKTNGIQVESKEEIKKRIGRSPDKGDAVAYGLVSTPKTALMESLIQQQSNYDRYNDL